MPTLLTNANVDTAIHHTVLTSIMTQRHRATVLVIAFVYLGVLPCTPLAAEREIAPMHWPEKPVLTCAERLGYAHSFTLMAKQGVPEERILISDTFEPAEARGEVIEIRRRAYRDRGGLLEVLACAQGPGI